MNMNSKKVIITGGGPAGLFCAYCLVKNSVRVELYDRMDKPGLKYILAGQSGLNITNSAEISSFASRYGRDEALFRELLEKFSPGDLEKWYNSLGIETCRGSSGKVCAQAARAEAVLEKWIDCLESSGLYAFHAGHRLIEIQKGHGGHGGCRTLVFETAGGARKTVEADYAVFALGGASWPRTGSDGLWTEVMERAGVRIVPFEPANCGFETAWSAEFKKKAKGLPLKNVKASCNGKSSRGGLSVTEYGIEGGAVYELGREIRKELHGKGKAELVIDLLPDLSAGSIAKKLGSGSRRGKSSLSNYLRKALKISSADYLLFRELCCTDAGVQGNAAVQPDHAVQTGAGVQNNAVMPSDAPFSSDTVFRHPEIFKNLRLTLLRSRPIEEAISSAGGVSLECLDSSMMLKKYPGFYVIGEMADWEAPTGGFLLQGCFSTAYAAAQDIAGRIRRGTTEPDAAGN